MTQLTAWRRSLLVATVWFTVAASVFGQVATAGGKGPTYDVVSIKPNKADGSMVRIINTPDRFTASNVTLKMLIRSAYNLKTDDLISGLPGWADSARFDVEAKMDSDVVTALGKLPPEERTIQTRSMMQLLLAERFNLAVHKNRKEAPIYALVIAKSGFKLKDADPNDTYPNGIKGPDGASHGGMMTARNGQLTAQGISIAGLVNHLSGELHREVVDQTGLKGKYDFTLQWSPDEIHEPEDSAAASAGPSIFTALQEQLGLKLESTKGMVDSIVVDHVDMPAEN